jgi:hypothetical protein
MATRKAPALRSTTRTRRGHLGGAKRTDRVLVDPASASTIMKRLGISQRDIAKARVLAAWSEAKVRSGR